MWGTHEGKGPGWMWGCLAGQHLPQVPVALCWARCGEGSPSDMTQIIKNRTVGWWGGGSRGRGQGFTSRQGRRHQEEGFLCEL